MDGFGKGSRYGLANAEECGVTQISDLYGTVTVCLLHRLFW